MAAINGHSVSRVKGKLNVRDGERIKVLNLLISSSPVDYNNNIYAVVIIENVSNVVGLQGLLPICSSCKKIKNEEGCWDRVDEYIKQHSEVQFTHSLCPECIENLYPKYTKNNESL